MHLLLPLLVSSASAAVLARHPQSAAAGGLSSLFSSLGTSLLNSFAPPAKPLRIDEVKPRIKSEAIRQLVRYGPLFLPASKDGGASVGASHEHGGAGMGGMAPAASKGSPPPGNGQGLAMDPNGTPFSRTLDGGVCTDCTVLAAAIDIVFANGSRADIANGVYLHHLVAQTMGNSTGKGKGSWVDACPRAGITTSAGGVQAPSALAGLLGGVDLGSVASGGAFVGGAVDAFVDWFTAPDGSVRSGYFIPAGSWGFMSGEVINYLREEQTVYVQLDIEWVKGKYGRDAIKSPLNVEGCDFTHSAFKNGGDRGKITSADFTVSRDVTVICQRAHMHDGGEAVTAFVNGKPICTSQATYGSAGAELIVNGKAWKTISKMSDCLDPVELKKGDKIRLEATYDNVAHPLRESGHEQQGNMAFMTFTVVPKDGI